MELLYLVTDYPTLPSVPCFLKNSAKDLCADNTCYIYTQIYWSSFNENRNINISTNNYYSDLNVGQNVKGCHFFVIVICFNVQNVPRKTPQVFRIRHELLYIIFKYTIILNKTSYRSLNHGNRSRKTNSSFVNQWPIIILLKFK